MAQSVQVKSLNDWHVALMDFIIANPSANLRVKAQVFGVSQSWLSIVENSDSFREAMKARQNEHFGNVSRGIVAKLEATADIALEEINRRMEVDAGAAISINSLKDISAMALTHLGFGKKDDPRQSASTINNNTVIIQDRESLKEARAMMARHREEISSQTDDQIIEGELSNNSEESNAPQTDVSE
jgi:hypothetical protein